LQKIGSLPLLPSFSFFPPLPWQGSGGTDAGHALRAFLFFSFSSYQKASTGKIHVMYPFFFFFRTSARKAMADDPTPTASSSFPLFLSFSFFFLPLILGSAVNKVIDQTVIGLFPPSLHSCVVGDEPAFSFFFARGRCGLSQTSRPRVGPHPWLSSSPSFFPFCPYPIKPRLRYKGNGPFVYCLSPKSLFFFFFFPFSFGRDYRPHRSRTRPFGDLFSFFLRTRLGEGE